MSPALSRGLRKAGRSILQLVAGGGLTALVTILAHGLNPGTEGLIMAAFTALVAFLHNFLETGGTIPTILPTPGLVTTTPSTGVVAKTVGTVDTVTAGAGQVVGDVVSTAGNVVGGVAGTAGGLLGAVGGDVENLGGSI